MGDFSKMRRERRRDMLTMRSVLRTMFVIINFDATSPGLTSGFETAC